VKAVSAGVSEAISRIPVPEVMEAASKVIPFPVPEVTEPKRAATEESSPVMQAAAQQLSHGDNVIHFNFTQNNTFSGASPDGETINKISAAGQQAADDLESRFETLYKEMMRNQRRKELA